MANYTTLSALFTATANAIRAKTGDSATIVADDFPTEIAAIKPPSNYGLITFTAAIPTAAEIKVS
jgi:hypothetical protein